jgi:hypothetical protein
MLRRWLRLLAVGFVLSLLGNLLFVSCLLSQNDFANFVERFQLDAAFVDHVFHFNHAWESGY